MNTEKCRVDVCEAFISCVGVNRNGKFAEIVSAYNRGYQPIAILITKQMLSRPSIKLFEEEFKNCFSVDNI